MAHQDLGSLQIETQFYIRPSLASIQEPEINPKPEEESTRNGWHFSWFRCLLTEVLPQHEQMASLFPKSTLSRGKAEVYVAAVPLRATRGAAQLLMSTAYSLNLWDLQHFMVIIKSHQPQPPPPSQVLCPLRSFSNTHFLNLRFQVHFAFLLQFCSDNATG